jgi:HK97 family phage portal protein
VANILQRVVRSISGTISNPNSFMFQLFGGSVTSSGEEISVEKAPQVAAVYSCVSLIADTIASLPFNVYEKTNNGLVIRENNQLNRLISKRPNEKYNAFDFRRAALTNMLLHGNCYILPMRTGTTLTELELIPPDNVVTEYRNGKLTYTIFLYGNRQLVLNPDQIIHLKAFTIDGYNGLSPITYARETIGSSLSANKHLAKYYGKGTVPPGILQLQGTIRDPERLKAIGQQFDGAVKEGRTPVVPEGAEYKGITMTLRDSQYIETQKWTAEEICRIFRVPPHKIGMMEHGVYNNSIEAQNHQFVTDCIRPLVEMIEEEFENKLINNNSLTVEMDFTNLMRGDISTQVQRHVSYWNIGAMSVNEIRQENNLPPVEGGDERHTPAHMAINGDVQNGKINKTESGRQNSEGNAGQQITV